MFDDGENIHQGIQELKHVFLVLAVSLGGVAKNWKYEDSGIKSS